MRTRVRTSPLPLKAELESVEGRWVRRSCARLGLLGLLVFSGCGRIGFESWMDFDAEVGADAGGADASVAQPDGGASDSGASSADAGVAGTLPLTVEVTGGGRVTSGGGEIDCPGTCVALFPAGSTVSLTAAGTGSTVIVWGLASCTPGSPTCDVLVDRAVSVGVSFAQGNRVFVTSTTHLGIDLGGVAGADAICMARAADAGLPGTYRAFLSDSAGGNDVIDRLSGARGWYRTDGLPAADTFDDVLRGRFRYPIARDERGAPVPLDARAFIGTDIFGRADSREDCGAWTAAGTGENTTTSRPGQTSGFLGRLITDCDSEPSRLYCFGVDFDVPLMLTAPDPARTRLAFISFEVWTPGGGLAGADAHCQAAASSEGLPGTYRALLATSTATAASRLSTAGLAWSRVDGIPLADTAAQVLAGDTLSALMVTERGTFMNQPPYTGATRTDVLGDRTCGDWMDPMDPGRSARRGSRRGRDSVPLLRRKRTQLHVSARLLLPGVSARGRGVRWEA